MSTEQPYRIDDRVVLVTGASRGIGRATAQWLRNMGGDVFGTATSTAGAQGISEYLGDGRGLVLDVTDGDAIAARVLQIRARAGDATILVNNAAITRDQILMRMTAAEWDDVCDANFRE